MTDDGFGLERRAEIHRALTHLGAALWQTAPDGPSDLAAPIRKVLLAAGCDTDLAALVASLLRPAGSGNLRAELRLILGRSGLDPGLANQLTGILQRDPEEIDLGEVLRIARHAHTAEDACASLAVPAWLQDPRFSRAYTEAKDLAAWGRDIRWRVQTLVKTASAAQHLEGDFVECGVDTGGTARAVMAYLGDQAFAGRTFYLFDTFRGLVNEQLDRGENEGEHIGAERYPDVSAVVRSNFADKSFVRIVQGVVPDTLEEYVGDRVAFLHIDMNVALPEVAALKFFWPLLAPGAPVVFDDYGFPPHQAQRKALDDAARELGVEILMLPTCQGVLIRPPDRGA